MCDLHRLLRVGGCRPPPARTRRPPAFARDLDLHICKVAAELNTKGPGGVCTCAPLILLQTHTGSLGTTPGHELVHPREGDVSSQPTVCNSSFTLNLSQYWNRNAHCFRRSVMPAVILSTGPGQGHESHRAEGIGGSVGQVHLKPPACTAPECSLVGEGLRDRPHPGKILTLMGYIYFF